MHNWYQVKNQYQEIWVSLTIKTLSRLVDYRINFLDIILFLRGRRHIVVLIIWRILPPYPIGFAKPGYVIGPPILSTKHVYILYHTPNFRRTFSDWKHSYVFIELQDINSWSSNLLTVHASLSGAAFTKLKFNNVLQDPTNSRPMPLLT